MAAQDLYSEMLKKVLDVHANLDKLANEAKRTNDRHEETMKILRDNFNPTATRRRGRIENTNPGRQEPTRGENNRRREPRNGGNEERDEGRNDRNRRENGNRSDEESPGNQENGKEKSDEQTPETPRNEQNQDDARSGLNSKREERREKEKEDAPPKSKRQDRDTGKEQPKKKHQEGEGESSVSPQKSKATYVVEEYLEEKIAKALKELKSEELDIDDLRLKGSPLSPEIKEETIPYSMKLPVLPTFNGEEDPRDHTARFTATMGLLSVSDAILCRVFPTTLTCTAQRWYNKLKPGSIKSFASLST
ncbi:uncharacterized protein LOC126661573 [Mercurialis annua]|uniref:uncharacterized protein LOC126661573 n=1 Tax=Mercurialis annua TaxID=3986 RepID=UPI00215DE116|nr:uncharacterized protein LOC126661573 [Mercurialis annua]